jgi:hypothetical protein
MRAIEGMPAHSVKLATYRVFWKRGYVRKQDIVNCKQYFIGVIQLTRRFPLLIRPDYSLRRSLHRIHQVLGLEIGDAFREACFAPSSPVGLV